MIASTLFRMTNVLLAAAVRSGPPVRFVSLLAMIATLGAGNACANGFGENGAWQFQTQQDRVHKGAVLDMIERKKAGFYDSMKPVYNYTTNIQRQYNCNMTASSSGNTGTNSTMASPSSPTVNSSGTTAANTSANSATNSSGQNGTGSTSSTGTTGSGLQNSQSNTGQLQSGVTDSTTSSATGDVSAGGGSSEQALNSQQTNSGTLTASITGSSACNGPLN